MTLGYFDCSTNISETSNGFIKVWRYTNTCEIDGMKGLILIVIPRSSAAAGTRHGQCNLSANGIMRYPGSFAAGSFISLGSFEAIDVKKLSEKSKKENTVIETYEQIKKEKRKLGLR